MTVWETFLALHKIVAKHKPELGDEFMSLGNGHCHEVGTFLDTHFAREGGWSSVRVDNSAHILEEMLEGAR